MDTIIVAEIGINHNGDINIVKQMIDEAVLAGCGFVKFQKRNLGRVYTKEELDKPRVSPWGDTNRDQKYGLELSIEEYEQINIYCKEKGIQWFASPWDAHSASVFARRFNLPFVKIASACITDVELLKEIKHENIPVILSTGMSTQAEVLKAVDYLGEQVKYILACTSTYPTKDEEMNLSFITHLKKQFPKQKIGFSNHHPGAFYCCAAAVLGADMIEYHMTLDRSMYGSDQAASIEPSGMRFIGKHIRNLEKAMGDGSWKVYDSELPIRDKLRR